MDVTTPMGCTAEALYIFEKHSLRYATKDAVLKAYEYTLKWDFKPKLWKIVI